MTVFFPNECFGKLKSGPGLCRHSERSIASISNWLEARALPAIEIALRDASPFSNMHTAHAHERVCHALFNGSTLTTPTFASILVRPWP